MEQCTLAIGAQFPEIRALAVGGGTFVIPADLRGGPAVLLFYRGRW